MTPLTTRALTLWRPWTHVIFHPPGEAGTAKRTENRPQDPPQALMGTRIALHAGLAYDSPRAVRFMEERFGLHVPDRDRCPMGIIGTVRLAGVKYRDVDQLDPWFMGPVGIVLDDVITMPEPIAVPKGGFHRGYWRLPDEVARAIAAVEVPLLAKMPCEGKRQDCSVMCWDAQPCTPCAARRLAAA